jgi:hypothetical protein
VICWPERAGVILGFHDEDARDGRWPRRALEAALCIAAGADLTRLTEWIAVGQERAQRIRRRGANRGPAARRAKPTPLAGRGDLSTVRAARTGAAGWLLNPEAGPTAGVARRRSVLAAWTENRAA